MVSAIETHPIDPSQPITTVSSLRRHLYHAAQIELSTIPLYMYAAYSIQTQSYSQWAPGMSAFRVIRSILIEEMLHLCLARNLMVAIGGGDEIRFYSEEFVPTYPSKMLHRLPPLLLQLEPLSIPLVRDIFMPLELPEDTGAPPQPGWYNTLGQFYDAVKDGFERLAPQDLFAGNRPDLQYTAAYWNQDGGGAPIMVCDLPTAEQAIATIVEQGEGAGAGDALVPLDIVHPQVGQTELSHYAKFRSIVAGDDLIDTVWPVPINPKAADFDPPVRQLAELFNAAYSYLLALIDEIYSTPRDTVAPGQRSPRYGLERVFISAMNGLLFPIADLLVRQPVEGNLHAAPTFEFHAFGADTPKRDQLALLCDALLGSYPSLGGDDSVRRLITLLPAL